MVIVVRHFEKPGFCDGEGGLVSFDNQVMVHLLFLFERGWFVISPIDLLDQC
jgi:hypothetical protein